MFKKVIRLFKLFFCALDELTESQLNDLTSGKSGIKFEYLDKFPEKPEIKMPAPRPDPGIESVPDEVCAKIRTFSSREEAKEYLESFGFKKTQLLEVADYYKIVGVKKYAKADLIEKIIEMVVGSKLRFEALLDSD